MKSLLFVASALACSSTAANATVTTFTNSGAFFAANPNTTMIENFEDSDPAIRNGAYPSYTGPGGEITFTATGGFSPPNVYLDAPGHTDVASDLSPTTSIFLAETGNEDWIATLANPTNAIGFDVLLNYWPLTITFFSGSNLVGTVNFNPSASDPSHRAFAGIDSTDPITSFHWQATNGGYLDTGIDNIVVGPAPSVPEPTTWAMMLLGFGVVGAAMRKSRKSPRNFTKVSANG